jgi:hypothetical protein
MQAFKKILFLAMTNKQFVLMPTSEYFEAWEHLSQEEQHRYGELKREVHHIWTHINTGSIQGVHERVANTIEEYNELVAPVSDEILSMSRDFGLTLKQEMNPEFKESYTRLFGIDSFNRLFGDDS